MSADKYPGIFSHQMEANVYISWNMPLFKAWSEDKLSKKFVVAENFVELVSKGKRFCLFPNVSDPVFPGGWGI